MAKAALRQCAVRKSAERKSAVRKSIIAQRGEVNTLSLLLMFLLSIASFTFGSLYFESQHKNKLLTNEVQKLQSSQILLMVPDEQAEVMANWMAENPHFVQSFVDKALQGESTVLPIGPGVTQATQVKQLTQATKVKPETPAQPTSHLDETRSVNKTLKHKAETSDKPLAIQQGVNRALNTELVKHNDMSRQASAVTVLESDDGVKLISLPHGGIRVTTREPED